MKQTKIIEELTQMEKRIAKGFTGKIIKVEETTSEDFYEKDGEAPGIYEKRIGLAVTVKIDTPDEDPALDTAEFKSFFAVPKNELGFNQSNLALFKKKYNHFPKEGIQVDIAINDEGFFRIAF